MTFREIWMWKLFWYNRLCLYTGWNPYTNLPILFSKVELAFITIHHVVLSDYLQMTPQSEDFLSWKPCQWWKYFVKDGEYRTCDMYQWKTVNDMSIISDAKNLWAHWWKVALYGLDAHQADHSSHSPQDQLIYLHILLICNILVSCNNVSNLNLTRESIDTLLGWSWQILVLVYLYLSPHVNSVTSFEFRLCAIDITFCRCVMLKNWLWDMALMVPNLIPSPSPTHWYLLLI